MIFFEISRRLLWEGMFQRRIICHYFQHLRRTRSPSEFHFSSKVSPKFLGSSLGSRIFRFQFEKYLPRETPERVSPLADSSRRKATYTLIPFYLCISRKNGRDLKDLRLPSVLTAPSLLPPPLAPPLFPGAWKQSFLSPYVSHNSPRDPRRSLSYADFGDRAEIPTENWNFVLLCLPSRIRLSPRERLPRDYVRVGNNPATRGTRLDFHYYRRKKTERRDNAFFAECPGVMNISLLRSTHANVAFKRWRGITAASAELRTWE